MELGPGATQTVSFGDPEAPLMRGWAELKSEDEFIATEFFQLFLAGLKPRVGVLPSPPAEEIRFLGFVNEQFKSGLAVHNPSPTEATEVTLRLKDKGGQQPVTEKKLTLDPLQSEAAFLNEALLFGPLLSSFEGVVEITVNSPPVAVLSLIQEASGDVATVAVETQSQVVTGPTNTALGRGALSSNTTGNDNTASGAAALSSNSEDIGNTASGNAALFSNTTGINNTYVGNSGKSEESNTIRIGNSDHTIAFIAGVQVVPPSAKRFKQDIHDMDDASDDLMSLRPVTFRYKKDYASGDTRLHYGLIAEEVAEVYPELVVNGGTGRATTVEYQKLTTMLLNELQKQHRKIEAQERRNADLAARLTRLEQE